MHHTSTPFKLVTYHLNKKAFELFTQHALTRNSSLLKNNYISPFPAFNENGGLNQSLQTLCALMPQLQTMSLLVRNFL